MFERTTKFENNNETPKKLHISLLLDESSIKKRPLGTSIRDINFHDNHLEKSDDRRSMTLTDTEIKRLRDSGLSPLRISTEEQDELNILAEEQESKPKKSSEKFQSFLKIASSQTGSRQSKFLLSFNDSGPQKIFPRSEETSLDEVQHIELP